jgi:uncharacterized tellurite resistance protein B-like protein
MGIFDGFGGTQIKLTPQLALACGLVYLSASDGHLSDEERHDILKIIPDDAVLRTAHDYCRRTPMSQFLSQAAAMLTPAQKLCMLLNMADMAMGDGHLAEEEREVLVKYQLAFAIPDETLGPYVQALMTKNNLSVFGW